MLSPNPAVISANRSLEFCLAGTNVRIDAPNEVLAVLEATLSFVPRYEAHDDADVIVSVHLKNDVWEITSKTGAIKVLGAQSALPQIAGAVVTMAIADVATKRTCTPLRASVLEKDGRALALVGDDWESAITLAAHLHGRGWGYVGSDNALFDPVTLDVFPIQKSLYVNSSSVAQFPVEYRRAVEASPWYVTAQGISFYAVDPHDAGHLYTWAPSTLLHGVVVVDGGMGDTPALESLDAKHLDSERFASLKIDWSRVGVVNLRLGGFVDTCDLVEHWFDSIRL